MPKLPARCRSCGYDLHDRVAAGRCPECGCAHDPVPTFWEAFHEEVSWRTAVFLAMLASMAAVPAIPDRPYLGRRAGVLVLAAIALNGVVVLILLPNARRADRFFAVPVVVLALLSAVLCALFGLRGYL